MRHPIARALAVAVTLVMAMGVLWPAHSATNTPPLITVSDCGTKEGGGCIIEISKSVKTNTYSKVTLQTVDDTAKAGVDYVAKTQTFTLSNNSVTPQYFNVGTIGNNIYDLQRRFKIKATVVRFGTLSRSIAYGNITDDDSAPLPPVQCPDGTTVPAGASCPVVTTPSPSGTITYGSRVKAVTACQSLSIPTDYLTIGATYTVTGKWGYTPADMIGHDSGAGKPDGYLILSDGTAAHPNDSWFAFWVPESCVVLS